MKWLCGLLEVSIGPISGRSIDVQGAWKYVVLLAWIALAAVLAWIVFRYIGPAFSKMTDHELLQTIVILLSLIFLKRD